MTVVAVLGGFGIYSLTIVFLGLPGEYENYLSPFYSPQIGVPGWLPGFVTPPMLVLWIPLGFRATCYYYRKAYFRAFFWDPPACGDSAQQKEELLRHGYRGERAVFILNNVHRYFLYGSMVILVFLWYDTVLAFMPEGSFGVRVGSILLLLNVVLLSFYTASCHSFRHLLGGGKTASPCDGCPGGMRRRGQLRRGIYGGVSVLNSRHSLYAWTSLFSLLVADVYLRLVMAGMITDLKII
jgi:hypothetical protein